MEPVTDKLLLRLQRETAAGNSRAFKTLYELTSPHVYPVAMKMMRSPDAAADVLQDAYVQVWHRAGDYHAERGSVMAWLSTIVRYRAIDALRKRRGEPHGHYESVLENTATDLQRLESANEDRGDTAGPLGAAVADDEAQQLKRCMTRLSQAQKQSVALAFFHGMSHHELAKCLALPLGTIKSRLRRSLQRLRECLAELGVSNEISSGAG